MPARSPRLRTLHASSALVIGLFLLLHIANHLVGLAGREDHIAFMTAIRPLYRNLVVEPVLLFLLAFQIVSGVDKRRDEIDALIVARLSSGWSLDRLDKPMRQILRAGTYELLARADIATATIISEYVDVAHAFYDKRESGFVNGLLDAIAKDVRG